MLYFMCAQAQSPTLSQLGTNVLDAVLSVRVGVLHRPQAFVGAPLIPSHEPCYQVFLPRINLEGWLPFSSQLYHIGGNRFSSHGGVLGRGPVEIPQQSPKNVEGGEVVSWRFVGPRGVAIVQDFVTGEVVTYCGLDAPPKDSNRRASLLNRGMKYPELAFLGELHKDDGRGTGVGANIPTGNDGETVK